MGKGVAIFFTDKITVETYLGVNSLGQDVFASAQVVNGYADNKSQLVRAANGEQVISATTVYTYLDYLAIFAPLSRVTVNGVPARVMSANANGGIDRLRLPDHLSVVLA
jgi:hypothetical protein